MFFPGQDSHWQPAAVPGCRPASRGKISWRQKSRALLRTGDGAGQLELFRTAQILPVSILVQMEQAVPSSPPSLRGGASGSSAIENDDDWNDIETSSQSSRASHSIHAGGGAATRSLAISAQGTYNANAWPSSNMLVGDVNVQLSDESVTLPNSFGKFVQALAQPEDAQWHTDQATHAKRQGHEYRLLYDITAHLNSLFKEGNGASCYLRIRSLWWRSHTGSTDDEKEMPRAQRTLGGATFECNHAGPVFTPARRQPAASSAAADDRPGRVCRPNARNHRDGCGFAISVRFCADKSNATTSIFEITKRFMMHSGHQPPTLQ